MHENVGKTCTKVQARDPHARFSRKTVQQGPRSGPSCTPTPVYLLYGRRAVSAGAYLADNELFTHNQ